MKSCLGCKFADWKRTAAGKLHPSGDGKCTYEYKLPPLPACRYWSYSRASESPDPLGGYINRHEDLRDHCPYFAWEGK